MLKSLGYKLEEFNRYCSTTENATNSMKEACFDMLVHFVEFITEAVRTLREDDESNFTGGNPTLISTPVMALIIILYLGRLQGWSGNWAHLERRFNAANQELNETLARLEKLSVMTGSPPSTATAGKPEQLFRCFVLPPTNVSRFFNRGDIFDKIDQALIRSSTGNSFRSVALFGLGGIGKSAIATRYVERKMEQGEYDAIFWVHGEKIGALRQSFTNIATRLKLAGADPQNHDENLILVQDWFQASGKY
jgi:hypothetical protein